MIPGIHGPVPAAPKTPAKPTGKGLNIGPWKGGLGPKPPPSGPLSPRLQSTFGGLGKRGVGAPSKLGNKAAQERGSTPHHSWFSLHTIEEGLGKLYPRGVTAKNKADFEAKAKLPGAVVAGPNYGTAAGGGVAQKWQDIGLAFAKNPIGTSSHTFNSIGPAANALLTGVGRIAAETAKGHPKALLQIPKGFLAEANEEYGGGNRATDIAKIEKHGVLNPVLDASMAVGGIGSLVGRGVSGVIKASGRGAEAFAKVQAYREGLRSALKSNDLQSFVSAKPSGREYRQAASYEAAAKPRPNLRTAPGRETPNLQPGAAVRPQGRSPNYFRARVQTAVDNARRKLEIGHLERIHAARVEASLEPRLAGMSIGPTYGAQLAEDLRRGEVMPMFQRGALRGTRFTGAERAQRIGSAYAIGGERVLQGRLLSGYQRASEKVLRKLTPEQRKLVALAKEGQLPLHDPAKAVQWLHEIHAQAAEGSNGLVQGIQHIAKGSDVARETAHVLDYIDKHGAESVFNTDFARAVEHLPDERLVSGRNPVLAANRDRVIARRYLPQMHMLKEWARRNPMHPDARTTTLGIDQILHLHERGFALRQAAKGRGLLPLESEGEHVLQAEAALERAKFQLNKVRGGPANVAGVRIAEAAVKAAKAEYVSSRTALIKLKRDPVELHARADEALTTAKNLADELAQTHGLPTDRAYIPHVRSLKETKVAHVGAYSPADYKRWEGSLQAHGIRSHDPSLVMRAVERSLADEHTMRAVNHLEQRFAVDLPRPGMTVSEIQRWMADTGRNPKDWTITHFGKLRQDVQEAATASHLDHLNIDETARGRLLERAWEAARDVRGNTRGASLIPTTAYHEIQEQLRQSPAVWRGFGKLKGSISKLMLGLSLPWATTMHLTYAVQSMMGGGGPFDFLAHVNYYRKLSVEDKARFDHAMGVDSPYHVSTHGIEPEKVGIPNSLQGLTEQLRVWRNSPTGKFLAHLNPIDAVLRFERNPRRLARINLAMKGVKRESIHQVLADMKGGQQSINKFADLTKRLTMVGRLPADEYMKRALANTDVMEKVASHVVNVMGEWHNMTAFERNILNRSIMFYPWMRYSLKLMAHTLPTHHPLILAAALKLGEMEHRELVELLGTEPELGAVYLGKAQPKTPPAKRKFDEINIKQANPVLNGVMEAFSPELGGNAARIVSLLPPYMSSAIGYAVGKNLFTDKPLTGAKLGESKEVKGRPGVLGYGLHELEQLFAPTRILGKEVAGGRPQASESAPAFGLPAYREYSKGMERKIAKEGKGKQEGILPQLLPFIPHPADKLATKIRVEQKEKKETRRLGKKQARREHTSWSETAPSVSRTGGGGGW